MLCVPRKGRNDLLTATNDSSKKHSTSTNDNPKALELGELDIRRKCQIATGRVTDHRHDATLRRNHKLDLSKSIFANVTSPIARYALYQQLGWDPMWSDASISRIQKLYDASQQQQASDERIPPPSPPPIPTEILQFMNKECNFRVEHADGSFMDHLRFLYDFTHAWYKNDAPGYTSAPLVMLLHSITGVGTNFFPMEVTKLPKLQTLLSTEEFKHVVVFPTFLRLLKQRTFIRELQSLSSSKSSSSIASVTIHRVLGNESMTLTSEEMWIALNYQLIHSLDFLPITHLATANDDRSSNKFFYYGYYHPDSPFLSEYFELYHLLQSKGKLFVDIKPIQLEEEEEEENCSTTNKKKTPRKPSSGVYSWIKRMLPPKLVAILAERIASKNIQRFSDQIGHSLTYEIKYLEDDTTK